MDLLTELSTRRKQYLELTKLYFSELQKGSPVESLNYLKQRIDALLDNIKQLENELNFPDTHKNE